jgi:hypothetical protein
MPKRNRSKRNKRMRGGFDMGSLNPFGTSEGSTTSSSSGTGWLGSLTEKAKSASGSASGWFSSSATPTTTPSAYSSPSPPPTTSSVGGRRRRKMRGGYSDSVSMTNLASRAAPFSGETARAQAYVGGRRTRKRCHKHKGSRKRHCRK